MSELVPFKIHIAELELESGHLLHTPLLAQPAVRLGRDAERTAREYRDTLQKHFPDKGDCLTVFSYLGDLELEPLTVPVPVARSEHLPALNLEFQAFRAAVRENELLAFVPALGLEARGATDAELRENLVETIGLEFAREKRTKSARRLLETIWYKNARATAEPVTLEFHTLKELERLRAGEKDKLLPGATEAFRAAPTDLAFEMEEEKERLRRALRGRYSRSILLVGRSGVGKTALVHDYEARRTPAERREFMMRETTAARLIQKLTESTGWQQNLTLLCRELREDNVLLFIRNLADLFDVGRYEGNSVSIAEYLREYIERGEIRVITECTDEEAAVIDARSPGYLNHFDRIRVEEPEPDVLKKIVLGKVQAIARSADVRVREEAVAEILRLQKRYMPYSGFPGKTVRFLESLLLNYRKRYDELDGSTVVHRFCEETGMPDFMVAPEVEFDPEYARAFFNENVFGQNQAVDTLTDLLASVKTGLTRGGSPIASLLFVGPTGVGKTETAKLLAEFMFGDRERMIRFDMSEYSEPWSVPRLAGADFHSDGLLSSAVRQEPFSVVLFDELEKAHYSFFDLLLQILGEGRLTDGRGRTVDFCSTIIIMTSNIGAQDFRVEKLGFGQSENPAGEAAAHFMSEVQAFFRPELFNRLDRIIPFAPLTRETMRAVTHREIRRMRDRTGLKYRKVNLEIAPEALDYLGDRGFDPLYGARRLQRVLRDELLTPLSRRFNAYDFEAALNARVDMPPMGDGKGNPMRIDVRVEDKEETGARLRVGPGMSLMDFISGTTMLRRETSLIEDGDYYIQLLNEFDLLERKKIKMGDDFWRKAAKPERFGMLEGLIKGWRGALETIRELEADVLRRFVEDKPLSDDDIALLEEWRSEYLELRIELYARSRPASGRCSLAVFGSEPGELMEYYRELALRKNFDASMFVVWLREEKYALEPHGESGTPVSEREGDHLVGMVLNLRGDACRLYFEGEAGVHVVEGQSGKARKYMVDVSGKPAMLHDPLNKDEPPPGKRKPPGYEPPERVHRKVFFENRKVRRRYSPRYFEDGEYRVERAEAASTDMLMEILDRRFDSVLSGVLTSPRVESSRDDEDGEDHEN